MLRPALAVILFAALPVIADVEHGPPPAVGVPVPVVLEFGHGATVDFADFKQGAAGPLRGYIYVRVQGELVVIPYYQPTQDGTMWRFNPQN
jgi:hypothetical protein